MTAEQYRGYEKPAPAATGTGGRLEHSRKLSSDRDYITIPTIMYTGLVRDSELLEIVIRILMDKRLHCEAEKESLMAILDLSYEEGE